MLLMCHLTDDRLDGPIRTHGTGHVSPALNGLWRSESLVCERVCAPLVLREDAASSPPDLAALCWIDRVGQLLSDPLAASEVDSQNCHGR